MSEPATARFADLCSAARRKALAARLTLQEVPGGEVEAVELLRNAWACVEAAARLASDGKDAQPDPGTNSAEPAAGDTDASLPGDESTPATEPEVAATTGDSPTADAARPPRPRSSRLPEPSSEVSRFLASSDAKGEADAIASAIDYVESCLEMLQHTPLRWRRVRRPIQIVVGASLIALACYASVAAYLSFGPDVWIARIYPKLQFEGEPVRTSYHTLEQDWGRGDVVPGIQSGGFSARFDSCLRLDAPTKVKFWLQSKEGSNLYVDGRKVVSNWNMAKEPIAKSKAVQLDAGVHHLNIDYFNQVGQAAIRLRASFDGGDLEILDHRRLEAPVAWPDQDEKGKKGRHDFRVCEE